jgi:hypothetical protein
VIDSAHGEVSPSLRWFGLQPFGLVAVEVAGTIDQVPHFCGLRAGGAY